MLKPTDHRHEIGSGQLVKTPLDSFESGNVAHMKKQKQTEKAKTFVKLKNDTLKSNS